MVAEGTIPEGETKDSQQNRVIGAGSNVFCLRRREDGQIVQLDPEGRCCTLRADLWPEQRSLLLQVST